MGDLGLDLDRESLDSVRPLDLEREVDMECGDWGSDLDCESLDSA